jgi:hypothetical protein
MPGKSARRQITPERANWVIGLFVKAKANPKKISSIAKKAFLPVEDVKKILNRKTSKREIAEKLKLAKTVVSNEQAHLKQFPIVVESAKMAMQQELSKTVKNALRQKIQLDILEHELMMGVMGLDWQRFPEAKLNIIKACYVVNGSMKSGRDEMIIPKDGSGGNDGPGTYTALFNRLALNPRPEQPGAQAAPSGEIFDLIPGEKPQETPVGPLPPPGESIGEPELPKGNSRIISVEVE